MWLGHTSLIERRDGRFVVRERGEIERLLKRAYDGMQPVDRLMSGLATVASALNANDQCLARIAAVHLKIPDLPNAAVRDALKVEDSLIKYARDESGADWNPALHPRTGAPPNPGWFAPTGGASRDAPTVRLAENNDPTRRSDASPDAVDNWVHLPPAKRIDAIFWNGWPMPSRRTNGQSARKLAATGGASATYKAVGTLNYMLSQVLKPGTTQHERQQILELIDNYSRYDPAEVAQFYDQLNDLLALFGTALLPRPLPKPPAVPPEIEFETATVALSAEQRAVIWKLGPWPRGKVIDKIFRRGSLHPLSRTIDDFVDGNVISNKSVDLNAATYQKPPILLSRLSKCVDELEGYPGTDWGGDRIEPSDITRKVLRVIIPEGSMTPIRREAIEAARARALSKGLGFRVVEF